MGAPPPQLVHCAPPLALLAIAAASDARARRIPNWLTGSLALGGCIEAALGGGAAAAAASALGALLGLAILLVPFALGLLGAGDVKLAAAAGAWLGPAGACELVLGAAVAGGALSVIGYARASHAERLAVRANIGTFLIAPGAVSATLGPAGRGRGVPYGIAIAVVAAVLLAARP